MKLFEKVTFSKKNSSELKFIEKLSYREKHIKFCDKTTFRETEDFEKYRSQKDFEN